MFGKAIRSELYRISRMKSTYILPAVLLVIVLVTNFLYMAVDLYGLMGLSQEQVENIQGMGTSAEGYEESFMTGFRAGLESSQSIQEEQEFHILGEGPFYHESVPTIFNLDVGSLHEILLLSIFIGLYLGTIYSTGLDKNLNIFAGKRSLLYGVRMLLIASYAMVLHICTWITSILSAAFMGESVNLNMDRSFILYFIITWFLTVAFGSVVAAMVHMTRSKAAGITLGIILSAGLLSTLISVASLIIMKRFELDSDFNLGHFTITNNLASITLTSDGHFVVRAIVCALIYLVMSYLVGVLTVRRRDIS